MPGSPQTVEASLGDTRLISLLGIITGVSATFSMAASNYPAERANGNKNTGVPCAQLNFDGIGQAIQPLINVYRGEKNTKGVR